MSRHLIDAIILASGLLACLASSFDWGTCTAETSAPPRATKRASGGLGARYSERPVVLLGRSVIADDHAYDSGVFVELFAGVYAEFAVDVSDVDMDGIGRPLKFFCNTDLGEPLQQ